MVYRKKMNKNSINFLNLKNKKIKIQNISEFYELYEKEIKKIEADHQKLEQSFIRKDIQYNRHTPYEQFNFDIQRLVPCFDFYRLHIKIAHFKIITNVAKYLHSSIFSTSQELHSPRTKVYFADFQGKSLCFKSFEYSTENDFHRIFLRVVKQWSIMKICSALQVSPQVQNYLGFDIIIYKNCIQFAIQKGRQIKNLDDLQIKQLKKALRLMHQFNIIHSDIKPENMIFSQYFNKPVFIDFGFSQIIQEKIGQKTLSSFKGTPNFCGPQMLAIIVDKKNFIDLYYNDAYSLKQTCKCLNKVAQQFQPAQLQDIIQLANQFYSFANFKFDLQRLIFYNIQFHYVCNNELKLNHLVDFFLRSDKQNIKKLLLFIKKGVKYVFLPNFFYQKLKDFHKCIEYAQIQQKMKCGAQLFYFSRNSQDQQQISTENEMVCFSSQLLNISLQQHQYESYLKMILNTQKIQDLNYYIPIIFECVRFSQKKLQFSDKVKIAYKINPLLINQLISMQGQNQIRKRTNTDESLELKEIKLLMRLLFKFCIKTSNYWSKGHLFDVFQQLIILNDYFQFIDPLLTYLQQNEHMFQHILVYLQLRRLFASTQLIKIQPSKHSIVQQKFKKFILNTLKKYEESYHAQTAQIILIHEIFVSIESGQMKKYQLQFYQQKLNEIRNPKIRKYLFNFAIYKIINIYLQYSKAFFALKIAQMIKKSINIYNLDLLSRANIILTIMYLTYNQASIRIYYKYIASIINCPQIFNNFDTEKYIWMDKDSYVPKIDRVIKRMPYLGLDIYFQLSKVLWNWFDEEIQNNKQLKSKYFQLYHAYEKQQSLIKPCEQNLVQAYLFFYKRAAIQFYFYQFSTSTRTSFLSTLHQYQTELESLSEKQSSVSQQYMMLARCRTFLYKIYLCMSQKSQQKCIYYFHQIIKICQKFNINFLQFQLAKNLNCRSQSWNNKEVLIYSTNFLFNYCRTNNQMIFYLTSLGRKFFLQALYIFARQNKNSFYQLLQNLTYFFTKNYFHATKSYFDNFLRVIEEFLQKDGQNSRLIHYKNFMLGQSHQFLKINPYLLIFYAYSLYNQETVSQCKLFKLFAVHCDHLSNFAKKKLMEKYYRVFVCFSNQKFKRQRIHIFRKAKNYIGAKLTKIQTNDLFKTLKKQTLFHKILKKKINSLVKYN